ncbi:LemA family protein [Pedobacter punctiformis]|uniref:LemA family protein n=1 Tax=Pedobacter punctiformis TaxID=3004097 RepID=A0ABT4LE25_9SPHI|nr:LemA family protein [Pedobacter sp. HCMS5-2]MCZ4245433.1 LemA family protein [Pedobacter sp. HCMS5-2]
MKKLVFGILAAVIAVSTLSSCGYNSMVKLDENVKSKWGTVQTQYQRRADLIPNLVSTVKGAAKFEQGTLTAVVEARAKATQMTVKADELTPENIQKYQEAQGQLSQALGKLLSITENYPELKATQQFSDLSAQLESTENRITVARKDFNDAVQEYNSKIRSFPTNLTAGMFGFKAKGYFEADAAAKNAPKVEF